MYPSIDIRIWCFRAEAPRVQELQRSAGERNLMQTRLQDFFPRLSEELPGVLVSRGLHLRQERHLHAGLQLVQDGSRTPEHTHTPALQLQMAGKREGKKKCTRQSENFPLKLGLQNKAAVATLMCRIYTCAVAWTRTPHGHFMLIYINDQFYE